jgi:hypothetical protein
MLRPVVPTGTATRRWWSVLLQEKERKSPKPKQPGKPK